VEQVFHFGGQDVPVDAVIGTWLLDALSVAVTATDLEGQLFYANAAAERLVGWPRGRMMGCRNSDFLAGPADPPLSAEIDATVATGQRWDGDFSFAKPDGTSVRVRFEKAPLWWGGVVVGSISATGPIEPQGLQATRHPGWDTLTDAEERVARMLADGLLIAEIGDLTDAPFSDVHEHALHVFEKLDIGSRLELARAVILRNMRLGRDDPA
jgi:PAS domain-containing protein